MESKRIILDTNLWISFLITNNFSKIGELIDSKKVVILFSSELIHEFIEVVKRPKFKKFFGEKDVEQLLYMFDEFAELIDVTSNIKMCRDEKDDFLLNLAVDGNADYLITGDKDLLLVGQIKNTKIRSYSQFLYHLSEHDR